MAQHAQLHEKATRCARRFEVAQKGWHECCIVLQRMPDLADSQRERIVRLCVSPRGHTAQVDQRVSTFDLPLRVDKEHTRQVLY